MGCLLITSNLVSFSHLNIQNNKGVVMIAAQVNVLV